jgi:hypothetical protein
VASYLALEEYYLDATAAIAVAIDALVRGAARGAAAAEGPGWVPVRDGAACAFEMTACRTRPAPQVPDALTSSMVDDTFYILRKCGSRALATGSVQVVAALLGELNDALAGAYRGALQVGGVCSAAARLPCRGLP